MMSMALTVKTLNDKQLNFTVNKFAKCRSTWGDPVDSIAGKRGKKQYVINNFVVRII